MMLPVGPLRAILSRLLTHPAATQVLVELGQKVIKSVTQPPEPEPEPTRTKSEKPR